MDWTTILLTSTVFAAVAALISIINTFLINKSKSNDSLRLFRYTKLYEILHELANNEINTNNPLAAIDDRRRNIVRSCGLAKSLVDKKYWEDIDEKINTTNEILIKMINTRLSGELGDDFNKSIGEMELCFNLAVERQMKILLKSR